MNIVIIEDEKPSARMLQRKLQEIGLKTHKVLHSVEESIEWFTINTHPDLIFLDIQLSDGLSFEIFEAVPINSPVIFTTAYDQYALQAFKLNSIDYILKPYQQQQVQHAIQKYQTRIHNNLIENHTNLKNTLLPQNKQAYKKRITIKIGNQLKIFYTHDLACIYSQEKYNYLYTFQSRDYLLDKTLETIEKELCPETFFRISRKHIVNINAIQEIHVYSNSRLKLILTNQPNHEIIVAREKVAQFKAWIAS